MATKSANLYARIEPDVKEKAESILSALGIPASSAINMFYKQIILQRGLPFEVKIPSARPVDISTLSEVEFNEELEKDAAGNNSYVRIDLKKYGDMINPILQRLGVNLSDSNLDEFERDWNKGLSIEEFRQYAKQELRKHFYEKNAQRK